MSEEIAVKDRSGYVYLLKSESGHYKIGRSKDPDARAAVKLPPLDFVGGMAAHAQLDLADRIEREVLEGKG